MNKKLSLKLILLLFITGFSLQGYAQEQVDNSNFENWDNLGEEDERPTNWNNMLNGDLDPIAAIGAQQTTWQSTDTRPGSEGDYSVKIQTKSVFGIPVNGTMALGKMHAPSMTPSEGFTKTHRDEAPFYQSFTAKPDSLVVWVKYSVTDEADMARISAIIHDDFDFTDPQQSDEDMANVVARAELDFQTNGEWMRLSIPFNYEAGPSDNPEYILITMTSSFEPGVGEIGATLYVDDLEMIYNEEEPELDPFFFTRFYTQTASQNIDFEMEDREEDGMGDYTDEYEIIINPDVDDIGNITFTAEFNQPAHIKMWVMNIPGVGDVEIMDTEEMVESPYEGTSPLLNALAYAPQTSYELLISGSASGEPGKEVEEGDVTAEIIKVTVTVDSGFMGIDSKVWEDFVFYPNPVNDVLNLKANQAIQSVDIFNTLGQKVKQIKLETAEGQLEVSGLNPGVYFMQVEINGSQKSFKLIKQ